MIGPKEQGGLDMPDFDIINNALKATWVKRLNDSTETSSWSHTPLYYLQDVGGLFLLQCNFDLKLLKTNIPIDFYKEALNAWQKINCRTPHTKEQVFNEIVWNNRYIKVEGFSVYYKAWHEAGVTKIEDIFQDNAFLPFNDFCNKFKIKNNFLKYYGLCHAVPQKWVDTLKGKVVAPVEKNADQDNIPLHQLSCKLATKFLVKNKFVIPTAERRMRKANLNEVTIQRIYSLPFKVTKDTRFQFSNTK